MFRIRVIGWSNLNEAIRQSMRSNETTIVMVYLNNISSDKVDALKATDYSSQLSSRPTSSLRSACRWCNYNIIRATLHMCFQNPQAGSNVSISMLRYTGFVVP